MDVDMHMDMEAKPTTAQSGTSSLAHPPPLSTISLTSLPAEIVLQVLSFLPLPILLAFRLVSTWTNTLVLEPVFWDRLEFSKQLLFKVGGGAGAQQSQHRRANLGLGGTEAGAGKESVFQHSSDANLIVHRQSFAATSPSPTSSWIEDTRAAAGLDAGGAGPSVTISANIPRSIQQQQQHQQDTLSTSPTPSTVIQQQPKHSPWTKIETSFLSFLTRLAHNPRTARGVRTIVLEDWEGAESVQVLWTTLSAFSKLQTLIVRNSVLRHLRFHQSNDYNIDKDDGATTWTKLLELNFQDCVQLQDLEGIQVWLPHLQDLSLAGCTALDDFSPLTLTRPLLSSSPTPSTVQALALKKASFIHTKIQDEDLIALLRRSPELEELRLDQCYGLTVRALEAIAFGDQSPASFGDGVEGQGADAGGVLGVAGQAPMTTMMDQEAQVVPPYHIPTATTTTNNNNNNSNNNTGSPHTLAGPSQSIHPLLTSIPPPYPHPNQQTGSYVPHLRKLSLKNCNDFTDEGIRLLVGCSNLEWLVIRGIRQVNEDTAEWLHSQGVPLRKLLGPLGRWRHWHV